MVVLGVTGSIGAGKSTVANIFRNYKIPVFDADFEARAVLKKNKTVLKKIKNEFPWAFSDGSINRRQIGRVVFTNDQKLQTLEKIIHPYVLSKIQLFLKREKRSGTRLVVLDIPLLFETGLEKICDKIIVVTAPPALRRHRVLARKGMKSLVFKKIQRKQLSDAIKKKKADFIISNVGSRCLLSRAVKNILIKLLLDD